MKGEKKEFERSLGKVWWEIALTRVNSAIVTHAPSQPHNVRIRIQCIIERLTWSVFRRGWALFLLKVRVPAPGRAFLRTPDDGEQSLIPGSLQPSRGRQWDAHTRLGETRLENSTSSRENKTEKIKRNSFFLIFRFDRLRLRLASSSSLVVWSLVAVSLLVSRILLSFYLHGVSLSAVPIFGVPRAN